MVRRFYIFDNMKHYTISVPDKQSSFILKILSSFNYVKISSVDIHDIPEEEKEQIRSILYSTKEDEYLTLEEAKLELEKIISKK